MTATRLLLASTSPYRAERLATLGLSFSQTDPGFHETEIEGEPATRRALRLAQGKAAAVTRTGDDLVLGCDQVAMIADTTLHKPGTAEKAMAQLARVSGQWVSFTCGLVMLYKDQRFAASERYEVKFRSLSSVEIARYVAADEPLYSAGSIKAEGLGLSLISDARGRDVNTLYGLPLMLFCEGLAALEIDLFTLRSDDI